MTYVNNWYILKVTSWGFLDRDSMNEKYGSKQTNF